MTERRRVLVVEDEILVAMLIEDMLADLGHEVVGPAMRLPRAIELAETESFDLAILDVNLAEEQSFPVACILAERGIPFVFATGYGSAGMDARFADVAALQKPFQQAELRRVLAAAFGARD